MVRRKWTKLVSHMSKVWSQHKNSAAMDKKLEGDTRQQERKKAYEFWQDFQD